MEYLAVKKWVQTFGFLIIILSIIELINTFLFLNTQVSINGDKIIIQKLIFSSKRLPITSSYIFIFLICTICIFLIMGFLLIRIITKKTLEHSLIAKYLLMLGVLIIIFAFIKMGYIAYLEKAQVDIGDQSISFKYFIWKYNTSIIGPFDLLINWTFYTAVVCCYLVIGLIMSGGGLNWMLELTKPTLKPK
jgi:hypothetical protein